MRHDLTSENSSQGLVRNFKHHLNKEKLLLSANPPLKFTPSPMNLLLSALWQGHHTHTHTTTTTTATTTRDGGGTMKQ